MIVYGPNLPSKKETFLSILHEIRKIHHDDFWITREDFNIIKSLEEKKYGIRKIFLEAKHFGDILQELGKANIDTINGTSIWNNRKEG